MNNHPLRNPETGEIEWVARNIAALTIVIAYDKNYNRYVLANKRGPNTPDPEFRGCWCLPCGYLDYDETIKECAIREVFEETGVSLDPKELVLVYINDIPEEDKRQNVTFRYKYILRNITIEDITLTSRNSEYKEVSDIKWINTREVDNYKWAFNHGEIIKNI